MPAQSSALEIQTWGGPEWASPQLFGQYPWVLKQPYAALELAGANKGLGDRAETQKRGAGDAAGPFAKGRSLEVTRLADLEEKSLELGEIEVVRSWKKRIQRIRL